MTPHFLADLALVLCTAAIVTLVSRPLRLPAVVGYLAAGVLVGPHTRFLPTADFETVRTLSELGVILLMFGLGLEFTFGRLARLAPTAGLVCAIEVTTLFSLGYLAAAALGWTPLERVFTGAVVSISSTMVISRIFAETPRGGRSRELVYGVLVAEDLVAIVLIAGLAALAQGAQVSLGTLAALVARLAGFLVLLLAVGRMGVPRAVRAMVAAGRPDITVVATVGFCFAISILAQAVGFSVALGAFLAGALVAESGASATLGRLVRPLRDLFAAVFFVAVGMLIDPAVAWEQRGAVLLLAAVVVVGKLAGVTAGAFLTGHGVRTSVEAGLALGQIGEFSFILAGVGLAAGAVGDFLYPVAVAVSVLTALSTAPMIRVSSRAAAWVDRWLPHRLQTFAALYSSWLEALRARQRDATRSRVRRALRVLAVEVASIAGLVIVLALGRRAMLSRLLDLGLSVRAAMVTLAAVALVVIFPFLVGAARSYRRAAAGLAESAFPPRPSGGVDLAASPRRALRRALDVAGGLLIGVPLVAVTLPFLPVLGGPLALVVVLAVAVGAFWRSAAGLDRHVRATAEAVVEALGRWRPAAGTAPAGDAGPLPAVADLLPGIGTPTALRLPADSPAVGCSLKEINLRGLTGATVVALLRGEERVALPGPETRLEAGDLLALAGSSEAIDAARTALGATPPAPSAHG